MPNKNIVDVDSFLGLNVQKSELYVAQAPERELYKKRHRTKFIVFKCSDGRLNFSVFTKTLMGIFLPFRNIGGIFSLGWLALQLIIKAIWERADAKDKDCVAISTYHFSKGSRLRGCKGQGYDKDEAITSASRFRDELSRYGKAIRSRNNGFFAIMMGIETDYDCLILHGETGEVISVDSIVDASESAIRLLLVRLYPSIEKVAPNVIDDMVPIIVGNKEHVDEVTASSRQIQDSEHGESFVILGRGADWLHVPNLAMIVGPWEPNFASSFHTAMTVVKANLDEGRIPGNRIITMTSAPYFDKNAGEHILAEIKSLSLRDTVLDVINQREFAKMKDKIDVLTTIVDQNTRRLEVVRG